jgi:hypothetical protein
MPEKKLQPGEALEVEAQAAVVAWVQQNPAVPIFCTGPDGSTAYAVLSWPLIKLMVSRYRRHELPPPPSDN